MMTVTQPHVRPELPATTWQVGPLSPREVARLLAEIEHITKVRMYLPIVVALIDQAADRATLYIRDPHARAQLLMLLTDAGAQPADPATMPSLQASTPGILPTIAMITWWATKPRPGAGVGVHP